MNRKTYLLAETGDLSYHHFVSLVGKTFGRAVILRGSDGWMLDTLSRALGISRELRIPLYLSESMYAMAEKLGWEPLSDPNLNFRLED